MLRVTTAFCLSLLLADSLAAASVPASTTRLSAAEVADRNVQARGGLQAWRAVQTMMLSGKLGAGGNQRAAIAMPTQDRKATLASRPAPPPRPAEEVQLPFVMELERPRKLRFELQFNGKTAVQVYNGVNGWKLRPFLNRFEVEPYTADEMKIASVQADLDGPIVDYAAKGTRVELDGAEKVEGRDTYRLKLTLKNGQAIHVWIDARTFLEVKIEGQPRRLDGVYHPVEIYFRDYREVSGLQIPYVLETKVLPVSHTVQGFKDPSVPPEKATIEKVVVNPTLAESRFSKPEIGGVTSTK